MVRADWPVAEGENRCGGAGRGRSPHESGIEGRKKPIPLFGRYRERAEEAPARCHHHVVRRAFVGRRV